MSGQTKMIIITSNEDIIQKFSFDKNKKTQIIDLENGRPITSNESNDDVIMNLAFLNELSKSNSKNDQVYKRALDLPQQNATRPTKTSKKLKDIICAICGDQAIGFNYDVLSCASCKAFFRRNAYQPSEKIQCLTGRGQCPVTSDIVRKCKKCRLERCLAAGMRRDFIQTGEEIQRKKHGLEENRKIALQHVSTPECATSPSTIQSESLPLTNDEIDRLLMEVDQTDGDVVFQGNTEPNEIEQILFGTLSIEDWMIIENVKSSFESHFRSPVAQCTKYMDCSDRVSALLSWSEFGNQLALRFIDFFRQINEFENFLLDDRLILIKYNLLPVFPLSKCYNYQYENDCCSPNSNEVSDKHRQFFTLFDATGTIRDTFVSLAVSLVQFTEQDPTLLSLLLIILMFTPELSMNEEEPPLNDPLAVNRAQGHYTRLLWNYFVYQWGEIEACKRFTKLLGLIFRMQSATKTLRIFFGAQYRASNTVDKLAPLMQSVLHIY